MLSFFLEWLNGWILELGKSIVSKYNYIEIIMALVLTRL